ncbi:MAG: hypothetical protein OTI34_08635 [Lewinella sp.]|nr:hypothetical protein [Lewinella sp.]
MGILTTVKFSYLKVLRLLEGENVRVTAIFVRKKIEFMMDVWFNGNVDHFGDSKWIGQ